MNTAWAWLKSAGDVYVSILEEWPVATAYAWPASLILVWWFL